MCELVLEKTGLLPHANPGVMDRAALMRLKDSNASVADAGKRQPAPDAQWFAGMPKPRQGAAPASPHIEEAGKLSIAFTTGILIGIGETMEERVGLSPRDSKRSMKNMATFRKSSSRISAPSRKFPWPRPRSRLLKICCAQSLSPA